MSAYSTIDRETFIWVKTEVESTLAQTREELQEFVASDDKASVFGITTHLHQIVGSLQMLELKSLSTLIMESELLSEDFSSDESKVGKSSFVILLESAFAALETSLAKIEAGQHENPIAIVELINQIRAVRGLDEVEISSLFSPMIDVFPPVLERKPLSDEEYQERSATLRSHFQVYLLKWLRDSDTGALNSIAMVAEKLLQMSTFGAVSRLWWVALSYIDYVKHNEIHNRGVHGRIFRGIDDLLRSLEQQGESALVRDPGEELIKIMLFYTGVGEVRTERMNDIVLAFGLQEYFPALQNLSETVDYQQIQAQLEEVQKNKELPLPLIRQLVTNYFEENASGSEGLLEIVDQVTEVAHTLDSADIEIITPVANEILEVIKGIRNGSVGLWLSLGRGDNVCRKQC